MTSHEYAQELKRIADELLARPQFPIPYVSHSVHVDTKAEMLEAVKALAPGKKIHGDYFFDFVPAFSDPVKFAITCPKNLLCHKVQEEVWACDPIFAAEAEATVKK